ncbi:stalk domain-containing protein [Paenibacillus mucilaginosus]|uniref:stalk domain-containing protein n=1 Tax=Paenibacillus mucilaginosus TaxID=61624 RepID=UPI003D1E0D10
MLSLVLAGSCAFSGISFAFGETPPAGVAIKEFSLLDTASDVIGIADFKPEGYKDGHFKLRLSLSQKTVINAVVLRTTDAYGEDNYHGMWRTNRVTDGWLLGLVQNKGTETEIINPGFRKDVKEPVGEFQGELTFDLYASNNGYIKETQYFVLEIETPQGTVASKPVRFEKPMVADGTTATPTPAPAPSTDGVTPDPEPAPSTGQTPSVPAPGPSIPTPAPAPETNGPEIHVFFKGQELQFSETQPVIKDGSTLVPFRKLFETLGFTVSWVENGAVRQAVGTKDGLTIKLTIDSTTASVNDQNVALEVPAQIMGGSTMVPLRFVAENSGYQVTYAKENNMASIRIEEGTAGAPAETPSQPSTPAPTQPPVETPSQPSTPAPTQPPAGTPSQLTVKPYIVHGYVRDAAGKPIEGASVWADNTLLYDSNLLGVTDASGYYKLELPSLATTWRMGGEYSRQADGRTYRFDLVPEADQPFAGNTGAVRNMTWKNDVGYLFVYPDFSSFDGDNLPMVELKDLEMTLTPVSSALDSGAGKKIVKRIGRMEYEGLGIDKIPLGRYKATIRWMPQGLEPMPLLIRVEGEGDFAESVEFDFSEKRGYLDDDYMMEFEVQYP